MESRIGRRWAWWVVGVVLAACGAPNEPMGDAGNPACTDEMCDDGLFCNGPERCRPEDPSADARGCVQGMAPCTATQTCNEPSDRCECVGDPDADGDGHDSTACGGDDCDDTDGERYPGNAEVCDPSDHDEDCDPTTFGRVDGDHDLYFSAECCNVDASGTSFCGNDCDDSEPRANIEAAETCDGIDNDCDGTVDGAPATDACNRGVGGTGAICESASCDCPGDSVMNGGRCDLLPPRAVAPLSTTRTSSHAIELRWVPQPRSEGTEIEVCADRACTDVIATARATADHATLPATRGASVVFWRLRSVVATRVSPLASPAWELFLPTLDAPVASAWGSVFDANLDALPDMIAGTPSAVVSGLAAAGGVTVFHGNGFDFDSAQQLDGTYYDGALGTRVADVGDLDGNGYPDIAATVPGVGKLFVYLGSETGFPADPSIELDDTRIPSGLGDVDGDGYADWALADEAPSAEVPASRVTVRYGGAGGAGPRPYTEIDYSTDGWSTTGGALGAGDVNGDGFADLIITRSTLTPTSVTFHTVIAVSIYAARGTPSTLSGVQGTGVAEVYLGGATGLATTPVAVRDVPTFMAFDANQDYCPLSLVNIGCEQVNMRPYMPYVASAGDLDGDGYGDVVITNGGLQPATELGNDLRSCSTSILPGLCVGSSSSSNITSHLPTFVNFVEVGWGGPTGIDEWTTLSGDFTQMGVAASGVGDVTGDARDDLAVSVAVGTQPSFAIYDGRTDRMLEPRFATAAALPSGGGSYQMPGISYRAVPLGDVDADGVNDILSPIEIDTGITLDVLYGNPRGLHLARWSTTLAPYASGLLSSCAVSDGLQMAYLRSSITGLSLTSAQPISIWDASASAYVAITDPVTSVACDRLGVAVLGEPAFDGAAGVDSGRVLREQTGYVYSLFDGDAAGASLGTRMISLPSVYLVVATANGRIVAADSGSGAVRTTIPAAAGVARDGALARIGDVDGDGNDDFAVGSPSNGGGAGRVEVFFGLGAAPYFNADPGLILTGSAGEQLGARIVAAGDLDGDGVADFAVHGSGGVGTVRVYRGATSGPSATPVITLRGTSTTGGLGAAMAGELDADGDGYDDLLVSAPRQRNARFVPNVGALYLVRGASDLTTLTTTLIAEGITAEQRLGSEVLCRQLDLDVGTDCAGISASGAATQFFGGPLARGSRVTATTPAGSAASGF